MKTILTEILHQSEREIHIKCYKDDESLFDSWHPSKTVADKSLIPDKAIIKDIMVTEEINDVQMRLKDN